MILRDYQNELADAIRTDFARGSKTVLAVAPTGSGKTVLFTYMARRAAERGNRVGILVHRQELLRQTSAALDCDHGLIAAGHHPRYDKQIQIASVQTLVNRLDRYDFDFLIVDEAHHARAKTYESIIAANPNARVLGVTATPIRQDGKGLADLFETMVLGPSVPSLIASGWLCQPDVYVPGRIDVAGVSRSRGDFQRGQLSVAADKPTITGCAIEHYRKLAHQKPAIAFTVSVEHAEHTAEAFRLAGYRAVAVSAKTDPKKRKQAIDGLASGEYHVVANCDLFGEGVDVPVVACGIMLRPR